MICIDEIKRSPAHGNACGYGYCKGIGDESLWLHQTTLRLSIL